MGGSHYADMWSASANKVIKCAVQNYLQLKTTMSLIKIAKGKSKLGLGFLEWGCSTSGLCLEKTVLYSCSYLRSVQNTSQKGSHFKKVKKENMEPMARRPILPTVQDKLLAVSVRTLWQVYNIMKVSQRLDRTRHLANSMLKFQLVYENDTKTVSRFSQPSCFMKGESLNVSFFHCYGI